jgi:hypothetical protein
VLDTDPDLHGNLRDSNMRVVRARTRLIAG